MCEKCIEIDKKIERCCEMLRSLDPITAEHILKLIAELEQRKIWLHWRFG